MRISMENHNLFEAFGFEKAAEILENAGFDGFDHSFYGGQGNADLDDGYKETAKKYRDILSGKKIVCNQAHAPFALQYTPILDDSVKEYRDIVRAIEFAAILGADNIIVHSIAVPEGVDFEEYNLYFYKSLEPVCKENNICVSVENLYSILDLERYQANQRGTLKPRLADPDEMTAFIKKLDSPWFNVCLDVTHAAICDVMPEDFIIKMDKNLLKALHVHDSNYVIDLHWFPYVGDHHWDKICEALAKIDYQGDFTLEICSICKFDTELIPHAADFAGHIARHLANKIESIKAKQG